MEQLDSRWTDFDEISDKNNGYTTWRLFHIFDIMLLNYFLGWEKL